MHGNKNTKILIVFKQLGRMDRDYARIVDHTKAHRLVYITLDQKFFGY